jgi:hypothetical protein
MITSCVNIDDVRHSSTCGHMSREIVGSRFAQRGYRIIEVKMRNRLFIPHPDNSRNVSQGKFILSRELQYLYREHDIQAVIAGT